MKNKETLTFYITEYTDGNLEIQTKHIHYAFRDDINFDDFPPEELIGKMRVVSSICEKEGILASFVKY